MLTRLKIIPNEHFKGWLLEIDTNRISQNDLKALYEYDETLKQTFGYGNNEGTWIVGIMFWYRERGRRYALIFKSQFFQIYHYENISSHFR